MDKLAKVRAEVERIHKEYRRKEGAWHYRKALRTVLFLIDTMQKEPVKIKKGCKYRCLSDMVNKDTGNISFIGDKIYLAPKDNTLVSEENGWLCDTSENASNFELVEEPVSEDLWETSKEYALRQVLASTDTEMCEQAYLDLRLFSGLELAVAHKDGAQWKKEQMMAKAIDGVVTFDYYGDDDKTYGCIAHDSFCLEDFGLNDHDKVKVIVIKED